ncbi:hypothetical protein RBB50_002360 [Rhinocladiella similis]
MQQTSIDTNTDNTDQVAGIRSSLVDIFDTIRHIIDCQLNNMTSEKPVPHQPSSSGDTDSSLRRLAGTVHGAVAKTITTSGNAVDRFLPPQKREQWKNRLITFASERPYLAGFLASQIALNGLPLIVFACTTVSVFIFSILAGILVGVIGGLLFVVPAIGFALLILMPLLFFTTATAVFLWFWGVAAYAVIDWLSQKETASGRQSGGNGKTHGSNGGPLPTQNGADESTQPRPTTTAVGGNGPQPLPGMNRGPPPSEQNRPGAAPQPAGQPATTSQGPSSQTRPGGPPQPRSSGPPSTQGLPPSPPGPTPGQQGSSGVPASQPEPRPPTPGAQQNSSSEGAQSRGHTPSTSSSGSGGSHRNSPPQQQSP